MVPKIIHCCWFGGPKTKLALKCRASWEKFAPDWEIREWGVEELEMRDEGRGMRDEGRGTRDEGRGMRDEGRGRRVPEFVVGALRARKWAVVSDWARMRALFDAGGVYLDYDVELVKPFVPPEGEWVAGEWTASGETWMNPGSGIALEKGSAVARHMLEAYENTAFDPQREMMPWINDRLRECLAGSNQFRILDPGVLSPIDVQGRMRITEKTLGIHHYAMSWASPRRRIAKWLSWHGMRGVVDLLLKWKAKASI